MDETFLPVGRLAPSPTGAQHVGNARTYLIAWLSARSRAGRVLLRIEDIDSPRVKPGAAELALADLRWLGLDWDDVCLRPENNNRRIYTVSSWQARQPIYRSSVERWRHYEPWLGELRELLPQ